MVHKILVGIVLIGTGAIMALAPNLESHAVSSLTSDEVASFADQEVFPLVEKEDFAQPSSN